MWFHFWINSRILVKNFKKYKGCAEIALSIVHADYWGKGTLSSPSRLALLIVVTQQLHDKYHWTQNCYIDYCCKDRNDLEHSWNVWKHFWWWIPYQTRADSSCAYDLSIAKKSNRSSSHLSDGKTAIKSAITTSWFISYDVMKHIQLFLDIMIIRYHYKDDCLFSKNCVVQV